MDNLSVIRAAMQAKGMEAGQLARAAGIHSGLIGRYLSGKTAIGVKNAPKIARVLDLTVADVVFGRGEGAPTAVPPSARDTLIEPVGTRHHIGDAPYPGDEDESELPDEAA